MKNIKTKQEILESHKIILIFGVPCAGKSVLTYNTFVKDKEIIDKVDIMKYVETNNFCLIGNYPINSHRRGLDTLERKQVGNLSSQVQNLLKQGKSVILEGNRCMSRPMMNELPLNDVVMLWIKCDLDIALKRANIDRQLKDNEQMKIINSTYSMCNNFINGYRYVDTYIIDTTNCDDFEDKTLFDFDWNKVEQEVILWL